MMLALLYGLKSTTEKANVTTEAVLTFSNKFAEFDETNFDDSSGSEATDMTTQEAMFYLCFCVRVAAEMLMMMK